VPEERFIFLMLTKYGFREKSYFRDLEFTVDGWESEADGKILKVYGKVNLENKMLMIELYDSSRKYVSGIAEITGKDGGMNLFEVNIYLNASFNPKTILVKTLEIPINRLKFHSIIYNASFIICHSLALVQSTSRHTQST